MNGMITPTMVISAVGTLVGRYFQDRTVKINQMREERKFELDTAIAFATEISKRMDEYLFCAKNVYNCYKHEIDKTDEKKFKKTWDAFIKANTAWEGTLNVEIARVSVHFGRDMAEIFRDGISMNFVRLRRILDDLYFQERKISFKDIEKDEATGETVFARTWNRLVELTRVFNTEILNLVKAENVGALRKYHPGNR
jgi:hypothetical protein